MMKSLCCVLFLLLAALAQAEVAPSVNLGESETSVSENSVKAQPVQETEIPVKLESVKKPEATSNPWFRMLAGLCIVGVMGAVSTWILRKRTLKLGKPEVTPEIKVLAKHFLGPKKELMIVRIAGESLLLGVTDHQINLVKSLSLLDEDIPGEVPQNFSKVMDSEPVDRVELSTSSRQSTNLTSEDEFSISAIANLVGQKLRNSRMIQ